MVASMRLPAAPLPTFFPSLSVCVCACLVNLFVPFVYHFCLFVRLFAIVSSRPCKKNAGQLATRPEANLKAAGQRCRGGRRGRNRGQRKACLIRTVYVQLFVERRAQAAKAGCTKPHLGADSFTGPRTHTE